FDDPLAGQITAHDHGRIPDRDRAAAGHHRAAVGSDRHIIVADLEAQLPVDGNWRHAFGGNDLDPHPGDVDRHTVLWDGLVFAPLADCTHGKRVFHRRGLDPAVYDVLDEPLARL